MATTETVTLTDEQLSDMRETMRVFYELAADESGTVKTADVEIADGMVAHIRWDEDRAEFVVDL